MDMPCGCPHCSEIVELNSMNKSNYGKHMLCDECFEKENQENCDHDWEDMGTFKQCTYPDCQKILDK